MENLKRIIERVEDMTQPPPSPTEILECLEKHPYFSTLAMAWLKRTSEEGMLFDAGTRDRIALYAAVATPGDTKSIQYDLTDLANGVTTDSDFYPATEHQLQPGTNETIDKFLTKYSASDSEEESAIIEQLIFNPVADYASILEEEERNSKPIKDEAPAGSDDDLINRFILKNKEEGTSSYGISPEKTITPKPVPEGKPIKEPEIASEDSTFSESLAKIYLRRKNYVAAHEIISKLNLKFPEKSIYFAVQLRFLEKLILNENLKNQTRTSVTNN